MGAGIDRDLAAALGRRDVKVSGFAAVGRRPDIASPGYARTDTMRVLVCTRGGTLSIDLDVAAGVVVDRPSRLWIEPFGPSEFFDGLHTLEELAVKTVEHVTEAVAGRVCNDFAVLAVDLGIDQDMAADLIVIVVVIWRVLEVPGDLAVRRMPRALSQRANQKPSWPASNATAMRSILRPAFSASSRQRLRSFSNALSSITSFFNGWRSTPGTMPATSQLDKLISITAISVLSCLRTIRDWFRSFGVCIGGGSIGSHQRRWIQFPRRRPIASFPLASPARFSRSVQEPD